MMQLPAAGTEIKFFFLRLTDAFTDTWQYVAIPSTIKNYSKSSLRR